MCQRLQFKTRGEEGPGRGKNERGIFTVHQDMSISISLFYGEKNNEINTTMQKCSMIYI